MLGNYHNPPTLSLGFAKFNKYSFHKGTGQAFVRIDGRMHYLGKHGSKASKLEYDRLVGEWRANGRTLPDADTVTVAELIRQYRAHVRLYYVKNGKPTSEQFDIACAMKFLRESYEHLPVDEFGPIAIKAIRQRMIEHGYARSTINDHIHRIRRLFSWGVENEKVAAEVCHALREVKALERGRTTAYEPEPVLPVDDAVVDATMPHLTPVVADMVSLVAKGGARRASRICSRRLPTIHKHGSNRPILRCHDGGRQWR